ncbi:MAG: hypothetical protein DWQ36_02290 [Acidobacteria bacterium]|nr:MAG: hypothetical protein DWQ30_23680 [Acidobacteriota bacterium]REK11272.1 MAG: hypothetical protein DWQ36_02290 [Acidobacteriota bacterium]
MSFQLKLLILGLVVLGDLAALAIVMPRLVRQGKTPVALILAGSVFVSSVFIGLILFLAL